MRRTEFALPRDEAVALLARLPTVHLASSLDDGTPVLRTVHGVIDGGWIAFHSAPKGEKTGLIGRPAVIQAEEPVATVPSTFFDPVKACPATTYYRSVQVHGVIEEIDEPAAKARVLQALMEKLQPEGGHAPITAADPMYRPQVNGLMIAGVRLERVEGKAKLAQNKSPAVVTGILESLWRRGAVGDLRALELVRAANPEAATPAFLAAPAGAADAGVTMHVWLDPAGSGTASAAGAAEEAADLLVGEYWNDVFTREDLIRAHVGASAWVGARDREGRLIASARAISDGGKHAWVYDVIVAPAWRGRGLGLAVTKLVIEHPAVRGAKRVWLGTRDAQGLYEKLGFVLRQSLPPRGYASDDMVLVRE